MGIWVNEGVGAPGVRSSYYLRTTVAVVKPKQPFGGLFSL